MAVTIQNEGRRAIVQANDSSGDSFSAFTGAITDSGTSTADDVVENLMAGVQSLVAGTVTQTRVTSTRIIYPTPGE